MVSRSIIISKEKHSTRFLLSAFPNNEHGKVSNYDTKPQNKKGKRLVNLNI